jgi:hypothetical protein
VLFSGHTLRVAHFDPDVAVAIAREQQLQSLIAWVPQIPVFLWRMFRVSALQQFAAAMTVAIGGLALSHRRPFKARDQKMASVLVVAGAVGLALIRGGSLLRSFLFAGVFLCLVWAPGRWKKDTPRSMLKSFVVSAATAVLALLFWASDEPWAQGELLWVSDVNGNRGTNIFCSGWVIGEQANGRWLVVLLDPSRSVVAIETSTIWARVPITRAEIDRLKVSKPASPSERVPQSGSAGETSTSTTSMEAIIGPTGEVIATGSNEETLKGKPNCPLTLRDQQGLVDKLRHAELTTTTTTVPEAPTAATTTTTQPVG